MSDEAESSDIFDAETPPHSQAPEPTPDAQRVLQQVAGELRGGNGKEAVRMLLDAQTAGVIPARDDLLRWIARQIGEDDARRLITAIAHYPCPACSGGLEPCPACEGNGVQSEGGVCHACIGSGRVRCDFCAGSGLFTYNLIPVPLRRSVMSHRVHMAQRQLRKLADSQLASTPDALLRTILNYNKLLCVLENAVAAANTMAAQHPHLDRALTALIRESRETGTQLQQRLMVALQSLPEAFERATDPSGAADAMLKAEYYRTLQGADTFQRTLLHHPFLHAERPLDEPTAQDE